MLPVVIVVFVWSAVCACCDGLRCHQQYQYYDKHQQLWRHFRTAAHQFFTSSDTPYCEVEDGHCVSVMFATEDRDKSGHALASTRMAAHLQTCCRSPGTGADDCAVDAFVALMVRHADILKNWTMPLTRANYTLGCGELLPSRNRYGKVAVYTCAHGDLCGVERAHIDWTPNKCQLFERAVAETESHRLPATMFSGEVV